MGDITLDTTLPLSCDCSCMRSRGREESKRDTRHGKRVMKQSIVVNRLNILIRLHLNKQKPNQWQVMNLYSSSSLAGWIHMLIRCSTSLSRGICEYSSVSSSVSRFWSDPTPWITPQHPNPPNREWDSPPFLSAWVGSETTGWWTAPFGQ